MALIFHNLYPDTIYLAFIYFFPSCSGTRFKKAGWWQLDSGEIYNMFNVDLRRLNRHAAFWAGQSSDPRAATWNGSGNNWYRIPDKTFRQCFDDNWDCNLERDFVPLDFQRYYSVTVVLGPKPGQRKIQGYLPPKRKPS